MSPALAVAFRIGHNDVGTVADMKTIWLVRARDRASPAREMARAAVLVREAAWPEAAIRISLLATLHDEATTEAPADLLILCWSELPVMLPPELAAELERGFDVAELRIEERVRKDIPGWSGRGAVAGVSLLAFCAAPAGQPRHETLRHWTEHVPLALAIHHGARRYIQNVVLAESGQVTGWFGIAEIQFQSRAGISHGLFRSEADVAIIADDVAEFVARSPTVYATEHVLRAGVFPCQRQTEQQDDVEAPQGRDHQRQLEPEGARRGLAAHRGRRGRGDLHRAPRDGGKGGARV